jgi:prepilin-type N-terminal cleavage/methylation domain-containing protein
MICKVSRKAEFMKLQGRAKRIMFNRRGFSLTEVLIVALILGIMASVAVPRYWQSLHNYRADLARQQIVADLKLAASLARSQSSEQKLVFSTADQPSGSHYFFEGYTDPQNKQRDKRINLEQSPYHASLNSAPQELIFDIYGAPLSGGTWVLNQGTAYERIVTIDYPSGEISVQ